MCGGIQGSTTAAAISPAGGAKPVQQTTEPSKVAGAAGGAPATDAPAHSGCSAGETVKQATSTVAGGGGGAVAGAAALPGAAMLTQLTGLMDLLRQLIEKMQQDKSAEGGGPKQAPDQMPLPLPKGTPPSGALAGANGGPSSSDELVEAFNQQTMIDITPHKGGPIQGDFFPGQTAVLGAKGELEFLKGGGPIQQGGGPVPAATTPATDPTVPATAPADATLPAEPVDAPAAPADDAPAAGGPPAAAAPADDGHDHEH